MLRQVVAPHEAFLTLAALEALVSCEGKKDGLLEFWLKSLNTHCSCLSVCKPMMSWLHANDKRKHAFCQLLLEFEGTLRKKKKRDRPPAPSLRCFCFKLGSFGASFGSLPRSG